MSDPPKRVAIFIIVYKFIKLIFADAVLSCVIVSVLQFHSNRRDGEKEVVPR